MTITAPDTQPVRLPIEHGDMVTQRLHVIPPAPTHVLPVMRSRSKRTAIRGGPTASTIVLSIGYAVAAGAIVGILIGLAAHQPSAPMQPQTSTSVAPVQVAPTQAPKITHSSSVTSVPTSRVTSHRHVATTQRSQQLTTPTVGPTTVPTTSIKTSSSQSQTSSVTSNSSSAITSSNSYTPPPPTTKPAPPSPVGS